MENKFLKLVGVGRFVFGLAILAALFIGVPTLANRPFTDLIMMLFVPTPVMIIAYPLILAGLYFTFSAKFRWRLDVVALIIVVLCFFGFYQVINSSLSTSPSIRGEAVLEVTILTENQRPVADLEVDVATKPGQPPQGGLAKTDERGVATFSVKPGEYFIFFNSNNFPSNLVYPDETKSVKVEAGKINQVSVVLKSR
jgi:hypothetical protein